MAKLCCKSVLVFCECALPEIAQLLQNHCRAGDREREKKRETVFRVNAKNVNIARKF